MTVIGRRVPLLVRIRKGFPVRAARRARSSYSGLTPPGPCFIRTLWPYSSTVRTLRGSVTFSTAMRRSPRVPVSANRRFSSWSTMLDGASTCRTWAGRPFFMTAGVTHASAAPDLEGALEDVAEELARHVVQVRRQDDLLVRRGDGSSAAWPP